jgi:signal transduction histidine kinase
VTRSLRSRLVVASLLGTAGLLLLMHLLSLTLIHTLPSIRGHDAAVVGTISGLILMVLGLLVVRASLQPLRELGGREQAIGRGETTRVDGAYPSEVQPLVDNVNAMLDERTRAVTRAHAVAGDLAHGLKTPLALLLREAELLRAAGQPEAADAIDAQVRRMTNQIDRHLARARVAAARPAGSDRCLIAPCVEALARTVSTLYVSRALTITAHAPEHHSVAVRHEDLEEILGNLLDNACKWARSQVVLTTTVDGATVTFVVDDDGEGLPEAMREMVLERGVRLDERAPGWGLGLTIVRDLVEHYRGTFALGASPAGGVSARVTLPRA